MVSRGLFGVVGRVPSRLSTREDAQTQVLCLSLHDGRVGWLLRPSSPPASLPPSLLQGCGVSLDLAGRPECHLEAQPQPTGERPMPHSGERG